jgi:hypothetical protein
MQTMDQRRGESKSFFIYADQEGVRQTIAPSPLPKTVYRWSQARLSPCARFGACLPARKSRPPREEMSCQVSSPDCDLLGEPVNSADLLSLKRQATIPAEANSHEFQTGYNHHSSAHQLQTTRGTSKFPADHLLRLEECLSLRLFRGVSGFKRSREVRGRDGLAALKGKAPPPTCPAHASRIRRDSWSRKRPHAARRVGESGIKYNVRLFVCRRCLLGDQIVTRRKPKVVVVMPAYNAAQTLHLTYADLPRDMVDTVILVDDHSSDETVKIARTLGLELFLHNRNYGYGANQKTCYREALKAGADIVVMLHPDYQYDPTLLPQLIHPIAEDEADIVLGSRLLGTNPMQQGMPWWKYVSNRFLTWLQNATYGLRLAEYHTGYRAFRRAVLEAVNFQMNSDDFIFDQEILAQAINLKMRIAEVPVPTRYFPSASSASFIQSTVYGMSILWLLLRYLLQKKGVMHQRQFDSLLRRYQPASKSP